MTSKKYPVSKTEAEWLEILGKEKYHILREKGTERPFTGSYNLTAKNGQYCCGACESLLFDSDAKFDSGCGWPAFDESLPGTIEYVLDRSFGMQRTEILCAQCGSHLGHVFDDGPTASGKRYCVNSLSLDFKERDS